MGGKMKNLTVENIARAVDGRYFGPSECLQQEITGVTLDSRKVLPGCLFVPIRGERADGNDFIEASYEKGALLCFSEQRLSGRPYILVESCLQAIRSLAEFYRRQFSIPVIGITGSVGKTSTKEMVASVLSEKFQVLKTQGNFNNEIGLPLTIFELREEHEIAVVEMGMSDFGEMTRLSRIARPTVCLITNIGPCHLENCGDLDGVLRAKKEIFTYWEAEDGAVFLNGDDARLRTIQEVKGAEPCFFGLSESNVCFADRLESLGLKGYRCRIHLKGGRLEAQVPVPGIHMVSNAVAAAAIGEYFGLTKEQIAHGIAAFQPVGNRSRFIETEKYFLFSDCYNANPASMKASINVMKEALGRKVCLLGDMFELGDEEKELHRQVGRYAAEAGMDALLCVGELSKEILAGAKEGEDHGSGMQLAHFQDLQEAREKLPGLLQNGDTILIKASHGMHFEELTEFLCKL